MPRYSFDQQFFKYFQQLDRKWHMRPLNLGANKNGAGQPAGGFIGFLPQERVSYDSTELATDVGEDSLKDNLNHIRYRLSTLEGAIVGSGLGVDVYEDDVLVTSNVTVLNFEGDVEVEETDPNTVTVTITSVDEKIKISANDTTADYLENKIHGGTNIGVYIVDEGGDESIEIDLNWELVVQEDDVPIASGVDTINFEGDVEVTDDGGGKITVTVSASGSPSTDEKVKVSNNDTTADYLYSKLTQGTGITVTELNNGGNETVEIASTIVNTDINVKVSSNDTTAGYLNGKLVAGSGIALTETNDGGDETLVVSVSGEISSTDEKTKVSSNDTTANYLYDKLVAGTGISLAQVNDGSNETLRITSTVTASGMDILYTKWDVSAPPASPSAYDDEFSNSSFDAVKWTEFDFDSTQTVTEDDYGLRLKQASAPGGTNVTGIYQQMPGDSAYTIVVKGGLTAFLTGTNRWGIGMWTDPTNHETNFQTLEIIQGDNVITVAAIDYNTHTAQQGVYASKDLSMVAHNPMYLRVRHPSSGNMYYDFSVDGKNWLELDLWDNNPTYMGVIINSENAGEALTGLFDFFRYYATSVDRDAPCAGQRVNVYS